MKPVECPLLICLGLVFFAHLSVLGDATHGNGALVTVETDGDDDTNDDSIVTTEDDDLWYDPNMELFEPTEKWKAVKPGQAIPAGLHVRLNLQTGEREAKLLDASDEGGDTQEEPMSIEQSRMQAMKEAIEDAMKEMEADQDVDDNDMKYWKEADSEGMRNTMKNDFTADELKEALKKFKHEKDDVQDAKLREESLKKKFRSMDELKKEFENLDLTMKTDSEILTGLLDQYQDPGLEVEPRVEILQDLEYHVHQIDNAQNLVSMGGLDLVIRDLNHTAEVVRSEAAVVVGSAVQSNPRVQIAALEAGAMQQLIRMLSNEPTTKVRGRALYAVSSLLRNFPFAQLKFLKLGGLQALTDLFTQPQMHKLQVKVVTLVNDLLTEKEIVMQDKDSEDSQVLEKLEQYQLILLEEAIVEQGWCQLLPTLLSLEDHDSREKVLRAMTTLLDSCQTQFAGARPSMAALLQLQREYRVLAREEMMELEAGEAEAGDTYFGGLLDTVNSIVERLKPSKEEL